MIAERTQTIFEDRLLVYRANADRMFSIVMPLQYAFVVIWAVWFTPLTYSGVRSSVHPHLIAAVFLGGLIALPVTAFALLRPGARNNALIVAVGQMLMGALLIHLMGGRIEAHFHIFVSLAFLSFYRDRQALALATLIVVLDHLVRGLYLPHSVYGVDSGTGYRFLEHAAWVVFEDIGLLLTLHQGDRMMRQGAAAQAQVESTNRRIADLLAKQASEPSPGEMPALAIVQAMPDAVLAVEHDGTIQYANPAARALFGAMRGRPLTHYFPHMGHAAEVFWKGLRDDARGGQPLTVPLDMRDAEGTPFFAEITLIEGAERLTTIVRRSLADSVSPVAAAETS